MSISLLILFIAIISLAVILAAKAPKIFEAASYIVAFVVFIGIMIVVIAMVWLMSNAPAPY